MGAFGDDARRAASGENWLRIDNGDVIELQILDIGKVVDKVWPARAATATAAAQDERIDKVIELDVYVFTITKPGRVPEPINGPRRFDPKCAWISDLIDLSDKLDKVAGGVGVIKSHKLRLIRADKSGAGGFRYGWIDVVDLGPSTVPGASAPIPPYTPTPQPAAPAAGSVALGGMLLAIQNAQDTPDVTRAWQAANAAGLGRDPQILAACAARKEAILQALVAQAPDLSSLDFVDARIANEAKGDMQLRLQGVSQARRKALSPVGPGFFDPSPILGDDIPF